MPTMLLLSLLDTSADGGADAVLFLQRLALSKLPPSLSWVKLLSLLLLLLWLQLLFLSPRQEEQA